MPDDLIYLTLEKDFKEILLNPGEMFLVSPFANSDAVGWLLNNCETNQKVTFVTRWRLEDITSGVSDVEVYPLLKKFDGEMFINNRLHAKYYRKGNQALVGSANLTHNGFSLGKIGNLELLIKVDLDPSGYLQFESDLLKDSILVDEVLYAKMSQLQRDLLPIMKKIDESSTEVEDFPTLKYWWPESRNPDSLWENYLQSADSIARKDLLYLSLPAGIPDEDVFKRIVMAALELHPNIQRVVQFIGLSERRFGEMRRFLRVIDPDLSDATIAWQTLFRWLLYFDPVQYEYFRPNFTEIIRMREN